MFCPELIVKSETDLRNYINEKIIEVLQFCKINYQYIVGTRESRLANVIDHIIKYETNGVFR